MGAGARRRPPPPPPGIQARIDQNQKAQKVADPIPDGAKSPYYEGGGVSSDPDLPASTVASLLGGLQDLVNIYDGFLKQILDPKNPVVHDVDPPIPSPLLPGQASAWDNCGGGVVRDDFNGGTTTTRMFCDDELFREVRSLADRSSSLSGKRRPGVAEGLLLADGTIITYTSVRGAPPQLARNVQGLLDDLPDTKDARGVGHGKCGLPQCISEALARNLNPFNAKAAAGLIRGSVDDEDHGLGIGPCKSCQELAAAYRIQFWTGDRDGG